MTEELESNEASVSQDVSSTAGRAGELSFSVLERFLLPRRPSVLLEGTEVVLQR